MAISKKTYKQGVEDGKGMVTNQMVEDALADLLTSFSPYNIFTSDKTGRSLFLETKKIPPERIGELKGDVMFLKKSQIWKILTDTIKYMAQETMFTKSKTYEDMITGKMMLYNISLMERILFLIESHKE